MSRPIKLSEEDRKHLEISIKKIIGQLQTLSSQVDGNMISDQTFIQLLAVKGGVSRVCKDIISRGVMANIKDYSPEELDKALDIIFKLD